MNGDAVIHEKSEETGLQTHPCGAPMLKTSDDDIQLPVLTT